MESVLFKLLEDHTRSNFGAELWLGCAALENIDRNVKLPENYDDYLLERLGERIRLATGLSRGEFWTDLGTSSFPALRSQMPIALDAFANCREFFLNLGTMVHPAVCATYPDAKPAPIVAKALDTDTIQLRYLSSRGLCELAEGFAMAVLANYGESGVVTQPECRYRKNPECVIYIAYRKENNDG